MFKQETSSISLILHQAPRKRFQSKRLLVHSCQEFPRGKRQQRRDDRACVHPDVSFAIVRERRTKEITASSIAGGETVSTCLAGTTYYLLRNPDCLAKLQREIVDRFTSWEEINGTAARQLPYLQAVINEGLRMYPPGPQGFPRLSPGMKVGDYWVPEGVSRFFPACTIC